MVIRCSWSERSTGLLGFGVDQHGDRTNVTKAAIRAVRRKETIIHAKLGIPEKATVDVMEVGKVFPYRRLLPIETTVGGLEFTTGSVVEELGDQGDIGVCVLACVSIGYNKPDDKDNPTTRPSIQNMDTEQLRTEQR